MSSTSIRSRRLVATVMSLLAAFALSGCLRVEIAAQISADRTVTGSYTMAFPEAMFGDAPPLDDPDSAMPDSVTVEEFHEEVDGEKFTGLAYRFDGSTFDEFMTVVNGTADEEAVSLTVDGDTVRFAMTLPEDMDFEDAPEEDRALLENSRIAFSLTFPDGVDDTNGEVDGDVVTWESNLVDAVDFYAVGAFANGSDEPTGAPTTETSAVDVAVPDAPTGSDGGSSALTWIIIGATVALAAVLTAVIGLTRRRTSSKDSSVDAPSDSETGG